MTLFVVTVASGLALGATYALAALGLVLAFRATETFNFAHGELMLLAPLILVRWHGSSATMFWLVAILSIVAAAALGALLYRLVLIRTVGLPLFIPVIATLGVATILDGAMALAFGTKTSYLTFPGVPQGRLEILGAGLSTTKVITTVFSLALAISLAVFLQRTRSGAMVRAAGQNPTLASQGGINIHRIFLGSWAAAGALAAIAGLTYSTTNLVSDSIVGLGLLAVPAMVLGGLDSISGAVVGGILIGLLQSFTASYLGPEWVNMTTYLVLPVVILVRPSGIYGTRQITRV